MILASTLPRALSSLWAALAALGFAARASCAALTQLPTRDAVRMLAHLLFASLPVVAVVAFASGAMLTVQAASSLILVGGGPLAGTLVGLGGVREVFPLLAAAAVAARSGAEFASALAAMKVSDQVDALSVMGLDPLRVLVAPRMVAATLGTPVCVVLANAAGLFGSFVVGIFQLGIDRGSMREGLFVSVVEQDLYIGVVRGVILGWLIGIVACREGLVATGGARGVGLATNRAVVRAMIAVCLASLLLTYAIYGRQVIS